MSRDDLKFDQMMKQMGVRPLHEQAPVKPLQFEANAEADAAADAEFAAAMAALDTGASTSTSASAPSRAVAPSRTAARQPEYENVGLADEEFAAAMAQLESVPQKDVVEPPARSHIDVQEVRYGARATLHVQASLDLHGATQADALLRLQRFVRQCSEDRMHEVAVIAGKGHHSHGGVPVLKPLVRAWVLTEGKRYVDTIGEAPRVYGGSGVWILTLRIPK